MRAPPGGASTFVFGNYNEAEEQARTPLGSDSLSARGRFARQQGSIQLSALPHVCA